MCRLKLLKRKTCVSNSRLYASLVRLDAVARRVISLVAVVVKGVWACKSSLFSLLISFFLVACAVGCAVEAPLAFPCVVPPRRRCFRPADWILAFSAAHSWLATVATSRPALRGWANGALTTTRRIECQSAAWTFWLFRRRH